MWPTEIYAAQHYRADRDNCYRILYLVNVGDPARMIATLLVNPFYAKAAARFCLVGNLPFAVVG